MPPPSRLALLMATAACLVAAPSVHADEVESRPLRRLARRHAIRLGAAVDYQALVDDPVYRSVLRREFDIVTPENAMKWETVHPEPYRYDFRQADRIVALARRHRIRVRGHTLVWHAQNPPWLEERLTDRHTAIAIVRDHVTTVVRHFRGRVVQWDVLNEAVNGDGSLRDTPWLRAIGPDYPELAFRFAHRAAPGAKLYYNDYLTEHAGPKFEAVLAFVIGLVRRGVPIHGVGFQAHAVCLLDCHGWFADLATNLQRVADLGLDVALTELDVAIVQPTTPERLTEQADLYRSAIEACLAVRRCRTVVLWGFTDRYSWIPSFFPGFDDALVFDRLYRPKPAYYAIRDRLR